MPATVLYADETALDRNDAIYGSNRLRYAPYINQIIGGENNRSDGTLKEANYESISYDALQEFPEDQLAKIIKPAQTEIPTVDLKNFKFTFNRAVVGVKMEISNLKSINPANAKASIVNSMMKQWDYVGYSGAHGNIGVQANPYVETVASSVITDIPSLLAAVKLGVQKMKDELGIVDQDLSDVTIGYTDLVSGILKTTDNFGNTGLESLQKVYPGVRWVEKPKVIAGTDQHLEICYRPMITQHHGSIPAEYATSDGEFGLSEKTLFVFESVALELEDNGAIVIAPVTSS